MIFFVRLQQLFSVKELGDQTILIPESMRDLDINLITADSRQATMQSVFVAYMGTKNDGHQYLEKAIQGGAQVVVVENDQNVPVGFSGLVVKVENGKRIFSALSAQLFGSPSQKLVCFGVTGTNGKTSMTYLIEHFLTSIDEKIGIIGTVEHRLGEKKWETSLTTPDAFTLQKRLCDFVEDGARYAAMEVSSHALDQDRVSDVDFDVAIFTNLTLDHLDYHKDMNAYFQAKQKLFTELLWTSKKSPRFAIVNLDDGYGRKLRIADHTLIWTYGKNASADFRYKVLTSSTEGTEFELKIKNEIFVVRSPLIGDFNVANVVAALAAVTCVGVPLQRSLKNIEKFKGIPGRLQRVTEVPKKIFVDYAHTPDALENTLRTISELKQKNRLIVVFGCGGDRDRTKRPIMGQVAEKYSDQVILTSDNPRTEDPDQIISDIKVGIKNQCEIEPDREIAIEKAMCLASGDDIVIIAGKGHEDYQIIGQQKNDFSDYQTVLKYGSIKN
jgi:UDP-N-acetylmuramoyl-L-alanyl-D-glutamate--2,6-diaminopimelate ligase